MIEYIDIPELVSPAAILSNFNPILSPSLGREVTVRPQPSYKSLFNRLDFRATYQSQAYSGTLDQVIAELGTATCAIDQHPYLPQLALHPARVIRAAVEHKVSHPNSPQALSLLRESIQLGLEIYRDPQGAHSSVEQFRQRVIEVAGTGLLEAPLVQPADGVTWHATDPERSQQTADRLALQAQSGDLLFIALAHGGVAAGLDVFLRYLDLAGSEASEFYVARFSRHKSGDQLPQLTPGEIKLLQDQAIRRQVVIFDEDVSSGSTLRQARAYFVEHVFPGQVVRTVTNLDAMGELAAKGLWKQVDGQVGGDGIFDGLLGKKKGFGYEKEYDPLSIKGKDSIAGHSSITKIYEKKIINNFYGHNNKIIGKYYFYKSPSKFSRINSPQIFKAIQLK